MKTCYECCFQGKDINKTLEVVHYAKTEAEAMAWLDKNKTGVYRNSINHFNVHGENLIKTPKDC
jgi:hypothetical protein